MSFESFLENITTFNNIDNVLVCEASFAGLRATAITKKGDSLSLGQEVVTQQFELNEAVAELIEKARQKGWRGQHAILVSPAVCMTVLELAIPANNKLPVAQLAESMQWEVEPAFNQHQRVMMIGQLLQYFGHLSSEELDEVLQHQNELANAKGNAAVYKVFGELAKEMFGVKQADLANCLNRQKWFINEAEGVKCGWRALSHQPMQADGVYKWVVAGVNQSLLREWQAAFSKHAVNLEACYPLIGGGIVDKKGDNQRQEPNMQDGQKMLLELHHGVIAGVVLQQGEPLQIQTMPSHQASLLANAGELYQLFNAEQNQSVKLVDSMSVNQNDAKQIEADLSNILGREVEMQYKATEKASVGMRNAGLHFFKLSQSDFVTSVSAREALPPVLQRFEVRALLAVVGLLAFILLSEIGLFASEFYIQTKTKLIAEDVGNIRATIKRIQDENKKVDGLNAEIKQVKQEKKHADTIVSLVSKELPKRNETLLKLLSSLEDTVTEDIVIEKITEDTILGFKLSAWSLSEQAAQEFVKYFQIDIHPLGFKVKDMTVTEETGRLGLIGYALNFNITSLDDKEWLFRKRLGSRPLSSAEAKQLRKQMR